MGRLVIGGTTTDTLQIARLMQHEHELLLVTGGGNKDEFEAAYLTQYLPHVRHERLPGFAGAIHPFQDWRAIRKLRQVLQKFNPQIVHTHTAKAGLLGRLAARNLTGAAIVHTYHGMIFEGYFNKTVNKLIIAVERYLATFTHSIIALSEGQKKDLAERFGICSNNKIQVVPLGIEVERFQQDSLEKRQAFRQRYELQDEQLAIGVVGRMVPIKNHLLFLKTAQLLLERHSQLVFFIVGDGIMRKACIDYCKQNRLNWTFYPENPTKADIIFTSWLTEIDEVMNGLDVVMLTSVNEGTPVSLMEAQAAGKPVIATMAGGAPEIVKSGTTGFVADTAEPAKLASLCEALIHDESLRNTMGKNGQQFARNAFQKELQVQALLLIYNKVVES